MTDNNLYICGECGCVFERDGGVMGNIKKEGVSGLFQLLFKDPHKMLGRFMGKRQCPECGSENLATLEELARVQVPDKMFSDWEWSKLEENEFADDDNMEESETVESVSPDGITLIYDNPIQWQGKVKRVLKSDVAEKVMEYFKGKLEWFKEKYSASDLRAKIASVAKEAGRTTVNYALLLYYALMSDEVPVTKKIIVMAALGYFIALVDFIPDFIIGGLLDDGSVLMFAVNQIMSYVTEDVKEKARQKTAEWFK